VKYINTSSAADEDNAFKEVQMSKYASTVTAGIARCSGKGISALMITVLLAGCGNIVSSTGPSRGAVMNAGKTSDASGIQVVEVDEQVARRILSAQEKNLFSESLGNGTIKSTVVGVGDVLDVTLWEAPPASLFGSAIPASGLGGSDPTSKATSLPLQRVGGDGRIVIPFAGTIQVLGRSTSEIQADIVRRLSGKAHQPQAIVRIAQNATSMVTIVGEVGASQRMPLTDRGERLLDAIAAAGGVKQPVNKVTIQITRGAQVRSMPLDQVIADPRQNIILEPNDVLTALFQPYSFTALGATGRNDELPFEASGITLSQALGRMGGLQDQRSDPRGVFIFRFEDPAALGVSDISGVATTSDGKIPVIYRLDLKNPESFFVAQNFPMHNKDVVYASNAPLADIQKFVSIISSVVFPIVSVQTAIKN
jgi:polysaccharide export outer membrane protein